MKGELDHVQHPKHTYIRWAIFYGVGLAVVIGGLFVAANRIRTYQIPSGSLELSIPYKKYLVGESISFTLRNNYNSTVYVEDECPQEPLAVYRRSGNDWVRVHDTAAQASCSNKERRISIAPYGQPTASFDAWPHLFSTPGIYRVVAQVDYFDSAPYQDFEVIAKPEKSAAAAPVAVTTARQSVASTPAATTQTTPTTPATTPVDETQTKTITTSQGSITVSYTATSFTISAVTPAAGCSYEGAGAGFTGTTSETTFKCARQEMQVQLRLVNGVLTSRTEN